MRRRIDFLCGFKERVTQVPKQECLVGEIFVFDLTKTHQAVAGKIIFKHGVANQFIVVIDRCAEAILAINVSKYGEENYQQFFIKVDLFLFVRRVKVNWSLPLHHGCTLRYGFIPIYLVISAMDILDGEHKEVLVLVVETDKRQDDVEQCGVCLVFAAVEQ